MNPVNTALWYVERHFDRELTLDDIALHANVSTFHLTRAFMAATGQSLMRYVRSRRLTEAARALARGDTEIIDVALAACYGSHEAFTRAFCAQFGITPEAVRTQRHVRNLDLVEALKMEQTPLDSLDPPHIEDRGALLLAGIA